MMGTIWEGESQGRIETKGCLLIPVWRPLAGRMQWALATTPPASLWWLYTIIGLILIWDNAQTHHNKLATDTQQQSTQGATLNAGWGIPCLHEPHAPTDVSKSLFPEAHLERN